VTGVDEEHPETSTATERQQDANAANPNDSVGFLRRLGQRLDVWRESIRARSRVDLLDRVVVGVVGGAVIITGLALVPLPGPGWVIVFVGLAILSTEFVWADRLETFARNKVKGWTAWLGGQAIWIRGLFGVLTLTVVGGVLYVVFLVSGVPGWVPDEWVARVPGL
jgi:uncharacterized protein (TIGR02611 family)